MAEAEFIIFCDESEKAGAFYSNFYGGVLVGGSKYKDVSARLNKKKADLHLFGEVKWEKVTAQYLDKYRDLIHAFFDELRAGHVKCRIMFRQNAHRPVGLSPEQRDLQYFLLYYQFIKHGFGLRHLQNEGRDVFLRLYFDKMPDTDERCAQFKGHIHALQAIKPAANGRIRIRESDIAEVRSHEHVLLQCVDIVLGAMAFRLNDRHRAVRPETRKRGKRTVAKEALYKAILVEIRSLAPGFNIGMTTGKRTGLASLWSDAYRHWSFKAKNAEYNAGHTKRGKRKNPA